MWSLRWVEPVLADQPGDGGHGGAPVSPLMAGLRSRCPRCGKGALFLGFLTIRERCSVCGLSFSEADTGDGPAVFVMMVAGFLVVIPALAVQIAFDPPAYLQMLIWAPVAVALPLALLRPFKATLFALQYAHDAHEARLDDD